MYCFYLFISQIAANDADMEPTFMRATIHELSSFVMGGIGESSSLNFGIPGEFHPNATADDNKIIDAIKKMLMICFEVYVSRFRCNVKQRILKL